MTTNDVSKAIQEAVVVEKSKAVALGIRELLAMKIPPRANILGPWLPEKGLCMIYAGRGVGKTHVALNVAVAVASGGSFLHWKAPEPNGVLYLDGEMPLVTMQERLAAIVASSTSEISDDVPFKLITPDEQEFTMPNLSTPEGQELIEEHLEGIKLIIVDNIATLCRTGKENDTEGWRPIQGWALQMRARGISVLFVHHSGKDGNQRGSSAREDVLDTVITLRHPEDYEPADGARFEIHYKKARGIFGDDVRPMEAKLINDQWAMQNLEDSNADKVARMLQDGMTQKDIASELGLTQGAVSKIKTKLGKNTAKQ